MYFEYKSLTKKVKHDHIALSFVRESVSMLILRGGGGGGGGGGKNFF